MLCSWRSCLQEDVELEVSLDGHAHLLRHLVVRVVRRGVDAQLDGRGGGATGPPACGCSQQKVALLSRCYSRSTATSSICRHTQVSWASPEH